MIWTVAAGILISSIPIAFIVVGIIFVGEAARINDDAGAGWVTVLIGLAMAAAIIWYAFSRAAS